MPSKARLALALVTFVMIGWPALSRADTFARTTSVTGHLNYLLVGTTFTDNSNVTIGADCLVTSNSITIPTTMVPPTAQLLAATLYVSGSLFDDGLDYPPSTAIFAPPPNLDADNAADVPRLAQAAQAAAAISADFRPPGAKSPVTVTALPEDSHVTVYYVASGSEMGNVGFFSTPIDVTASIANQGAGQLAGTYTVSGWRADICRGQEAVCGVARCSTLSATHSNANASAALLLVYQDLSLPLRTVSVFNGLEELTGQNTVLTLNLAAPISDPALATLSYYVLAGDLSVGVANPAAVCGADEYVWVQASQAALCLNDADNPVGNVFNGSINNLASPTVSPPSCVPATQCCFGPHACGLAGVDIDTFDIGPALTPGDQVIDVGIGTAADRVALATVVVAVDVSQPILSADTQIRVLNDPSPNAAQLGGNVTYSLAVSNTGNAAAGQTLAVVTLPPGVTHPNLMTYPAGSTVIATASGWNIAGFRVDPGKIAEVRFSFTVDCSLLDQPLPVMANVSATAIAPFPVNAPMLTVGGPGVGDCLGRDPAGPFVHLSPARVLRGNGCATSGKASPLGLLLALAGAGRVARRRTLQRFHSGPRSGRRLRHGRLTYLLGCCGFLIACEPLYSPPGHPSQALTSTSNLPGMACPAHPLMAAFVDPNGHAFCIDRFEATAQQGHWGSANPGSDDTSTMTDPAATVVAEQALAAQPAVNVSWYQAKAACHNAGKRLCSQAEWEAACSGVGLVYPYGNTLDDTACNGFFQYNPDNPARTGSFKRCVSGAGAYDLSGNVEEWLDTAVPRVAGTSQLNDRLVHGGSYVANGTALGCLGTTFHHAPGSISADRGFRCCVDR